MIQQAFFFGLGAFLITFALVPLVSFFAYKKDLVDRPDGVIKNHKKAIPAFGGVALFLGVFPFLAYLTVTTSALITYLLIGSFLLLALGVLDDIIVLSPLQKFLGQCVSVVLFLYLGSFFKALFFTSLPHILFLAFWMLTIINAFNLIDVMDGLAATVGIWASFSFLVLAYAFNAQIPFLITSVLIGGLFGFLKYNKPNAQIYFGDGGALFLGGLLSTLPLFFNWSFYSPLSCFAPLFIFAIPLCEVAMLIIIRTYKKIPFFQGSPHHFCHYLLKRGWAKKQVLLLVSLISVVLLLVSFDVAFGKASLFEMALFVALASIVWIAFIYRPFLTRKQDFMLR